MRVLFLIGCDLYSFNFANELCMAFAKNDFEASFLVFRNEQAIHYDKLQNEIKDLIYYERTVFCETLLPYLRNHPNQGKYLSLEALSKKYEINYAYCHNLENKAALEFILAHAKKWKIDIAVTIRCIEKYSSLLIDFFSQQDDTYFWNLHPGLLPEYRGIMPVFGAMINHEINFGFTLHRVSDKLDNGPIIEFAQQKIDYTKSMLKNTLDLIPTGIDLLIKNLTKVSKNIKLDCITQDEARQGFYSFPSAEEINQFRSQNMIMYTKDEIIREMQTQYLANDQGNIFPDLST